jgi:hypothetical protein
MSACRALLPALVAVLGLGPVVPPEHAHAVEEHGHREVIVHQHAHSHAIGHLLGRDAHRAFDHPDDPVLTFSAVYTTPAPQMPAIPSRIVVGLVQPLLNEAGRPTNGFVELLIHGPPRAPTGLRAPPAFPA